MNTYQMGQVAAFAKFAELGTLAKAILEHAGIGAATGGAMGGITGAIAAPSGQRLEGAGKGMLAGGLVGGALGAGGRTLAGRTGVAHPDAGKISPVTGQPVVLSNLAESGHRLLGGATSALSGGVAGAAAAPNEDTMLEKIKAKLGLS